MNEKGKEGISGYEPKVLVNTKRVDSPSGMSGLSPRGEKSDGKEMVEIYVTDNGKGISKNIIDKIFQPFFTTKPTGQGTGLGLSLSYDIVQAHGGELTVESVVGEGTSFRVVLPVITGSFPTPRNFSNANVTGSFPTPPQFFQCECDGVVSYAPAIFPMRM